MTVVPNDGRTVHVANANAAVALCAVGNHANVEDGLASVRNLHADLILEKDHTIRNDAAPLLLSSSSLLAVVEDVEDDTAVATVAAVACVS